MDRKNMISQKEAQMRTRAAKRKNKKLAKASFVLMLVALMCLSIVMGAMLGFVDNTTDLIARENNLDFTSVIYYTDDETGELSEYETIHSEQNRIWVDLSDMPIELKEAFISIEDERFLTHHGVDWKRTTGAIFKWFISKDSAYGGSTITQQLIKNVTGDSKRSPIRKIQEIIRALNLEQKMSKDEIIEMYMNTIYLGQGCHGVQTASNKYFSKDVSELSLAECASIAGITQYPAKYDPFLNFEAHKEKQELVLSKMLELGYITEEEHDSAVGEKLVLREGAIKSGSAEIQSYFTDLVVKDVLDGLMEKHKMSESEATKALYKGGLKIYSTVSPKVQNAMDKVFGSFSDTVLKESDYQSAMVVIDPKNGYIKGIIGGRGKKEGNRVLNRASQSIRQPGSSIKPVAVYAPAIEKKLITAASIVKDEPITIGTWSPNNVDRKFMGDITVRVAVEKSRNIPAVKVLQKLGVDESYDFMTKKLGFTTLVDSERREDGKIHSDKHLGSLALGGLTDGVSPLEMTAAYAAFANGGIYNKPVTYTKVIDSNGMVILENKPEQMRAMSAETAYIVSNMLSGVINYGTGGGAHLASGQWAAGKTGTSDDNKDKWFVGYTPYYVGGAWSGYDIAQKYGGIGTNPSITFWKRVMDEIHKGLPHKTLVQPNDMIVRTICQESGLLASEICENKRIDYFKRGTQPSAFCESHDEEDIIFDENGEPVVNGETNDDGGANGAEEGGGAEGDTHGEETTPNTSPGEAEDGETAWWGEEE